MADEKEIDDLDDLEADDLNLENIELDEMSSNTDPDLATLDDSSDLMDTEVNDQELEEYGVWVKVEPETIDAEEEPQEEPTMSDLEDTEEIKIPAEDDLNLDAEPETLADDFGDTMEDLDSELTTEDEPDLDEMGTLPTAEADLDLAELEDDTAGLDLGAADEGIEDLPEIDLENEEVEVPLSDSASLDDEENTILPGQNNLEAAGANTLKQIEKELSSIKKELAELKKELSGLRKSAATAEEKAGKEPSGFFDDDEDEVIALTGDELDNILESADITEESVDKDAIGEEDLSLDIPEEETLNLESEPEDMDEIEIDLPDDQGAEEADTELGDFDLEENTKMPDDIELADLDEESASESDSMEPGDDLETLELEGDLEAMSLEEPEQELDSLETEDETLNLEDESPVLESSQPEEELDEITLEEPTEEIGEIELEEPTEAIDTIELEELAEEDGALDEGGFETLDEEPETEIGELDEETDELEATELSPEGDFEEIDLEMESQDVQELEEDLEDIKELEEDLEDIKEVEEIDLEVPEESTISEMEEIEESALEEEPAVGGSATSPDTKRIPDDLKSEIRSVLSYMDQLLDALPEEKIEEFAKSEYFDVYKRLFEELGIKN